MFDRTKRSHQIFAAALTALFILLSATADASTTFHAEEQGAKISAKEAVKRAAKSEPVFRCRRIRVGPSGNPVSVPGSKYTFHTAIGTALDAVGERIANGEKTWKCEAMELNEENGRLRKGQDIEVDDE